MTSAQQIHEYFDGGLNDPEKDALFMKIGSDSGMRTEFEQQLRLQMIAQNDMNSITPPFESTNLIFSSLGFSIPANQNWGGSSGIKPKDNALAKFWKRNLSMILTAFVASLVTALLFISYQDGIFGGGGSGSAVRNAIPLVSSVENSDASKSNAGIDKHENVLMQNNSENLIRIGTGNNSNIAKNGYTSGSRRYSGRNSNNASSKSGSGSSFALNNDNSGDTGFDSDEIDGSGGNAGLLAIADANGSQVSTFGELSAKNSVRTKFSPFDRYPEVTQSRYPLLAVDVLSLTRKIDSTKFSVNVFYLSSNSVQDVGLPTNSDSWLRNFGIGAYYKLSPSHSIGIEFGNESFSQQFITTQSGKPDNFRQNPNLFWYGIAYRFTIRDMFGDIIQPFGQLFAGSAEVGALVKPELGMNLRLYQNVSMSAALHWGILIYNVEGNYYNSEKFGLTWGLNYSF
ncbi:MAG: hypothetical protein QG635_2245 [Bacteroidota bacterium]|nr:hypothetical protein [Bacteroidota bacterium]